jgi:hypothetical protein
LFEFLENKNFKITKVQKYNETTGFFCVENNLNTKR